VVYIRAFSQLIHLIEECYCVSRELILLLDANIITPKSKDDATYVALASVYRCNMIVSWNFKHIVHFEKISKYNAVNTINGYGYLGIFSPSEVIKYDDA
jgi:hypothetical protein